jgi:hypothetical protein
MFGRFAGTPAFEAFFELFRLRAAGRFFEALEVRVLTVATVFRPDTGT